MATGIIDCTLLKPCSEERIANFLVSFPLVLITTVSVCASQVLMNSFLQQPFRICACVRARVCVHGEEEGRHRKI